MRIVCPSCGATIPGDDIDLRGGRAVCRPCSELILLPDAGVVALERSLASQPFDDPLDLPTPSAPAAYRPADLQIAETEVGDARVLTLAPSRWSAAPLLGFAAVWDAFLVFWYAAAFGIGSGGPGGVMLWFPLLHVGAGVYVTWLGLQRLLNSTRITLGRGALEVRQGPLPGPHLVEPVTNLLRFEPAARGARAHAQRGANPRFTVRALTADGRSVELPIELQTAEHAAHLAHRLNRWLDDERAPDGYRGKLALEVAPRAPLALPEPERS